MHTCTCVLVYTTGAQLTTEWCLSSGGVIAISLLQLRPSVCRGKMNPSVETFLSCVSSSLEMNQTNDALCTRCRLLYSEIGNETKTCACVRGRSRGHVASSRARRGSRVEDSKIDLVSVPDVCLGPRLISAVPMSRDFAIMCCTVHVRALGEDS